MLHNTLLRGVGGALKSSSLTSTGISGNFASSHSLRLLVQHTQVRGFYRVSDSEREKFRVKYKQEPNYAVDPAAKWHEKWQENLSTANSGMEETVRQDQGRWNKYPFYLLGGMAVYYAIYYFSFDDEIAQWAKDTKRFLTSYVFEPLLKNKENANEWIDRMVGPGERLLLPPPMPDGYGHKYTLVVDLDALIDTFPAKNGQVLITKRPGVDYFVSNASKYYEIVLYSKEMGGTNQMIIYKIDPSNSFSHHLFKESGLKDHDKFIHDFTRLNRDPSKVIFIDSNSLNNLYEHKNVISVGKGHPKNPDTILIDLVPILAKIAADNTPDVRTKLPELQTPDIANKLRQILGKAPVTQSSSSTQQSTGGVFGFLKK